MTSNSRFDDALRRKVAGYVMAPEGYVLENIFSHEAMQARRRVRRRFFFILFFLLSSSSLTTMALMLNRGWFGGDSKESVVAQAAQTKSPGTSISQLPAGTATEQVVEMTVPATAPAVVHVSRPVPPRSTDAATTESVDPVTPTTNAEKAELLRSAKGDVMSLDLDEGNLPPSVPVWEVITTEAPKNEFHLGTQVTIGRSSIRNEDEFNTYDGTSLTPGTDIGVTFGVTTGYDFHRRIGIESGVNFLSLQGQRYSGMVGRVQVTQEVLLSYVSFPVYLKFKHQLTDGNVPIVLNALIGGHYGTLKSAELSLNGAFPGDDISEMFAQREIAYGGGLTADFYVDKSLYITLGFRGTLSKDISGAGFQSNEPVRNLLMGANFGLNFALTR